MTSTRTRLFTTSLFATLALGSLTAYAASTLYTLDTDATITQVSGNIPGWSTSIGPEDGVNYQGIYEVSMWEDGDSPCKIRMKSRHLNTYVGKNDTWSDGQCSPGSGSEKTLSFVNSETYIRGVNVCLNNAGTRVKGLRLYGTKLDRATGTLNNLAGSKEWERPNCNGNWKTVRYCPAGKVATRINIQYQSQLFIGDEIAGLSLTCRSVIPK